MADNFGNSQGNEIPCKQSKSYEGIQNFLNSVYFDSEAKLVMYEIFLES